MGSAVLQSSGGSVFPSKLTKIHEQFRKWHMEGRIMPGYEMGEGSPYLSKLLEIPFNPPNGHYPLLHEIEQKHPNLLDGLLGPHGWAILKIMIARRNLK